MVKKTTAQKRGDDVRAVADKLKKVRLKLQNKKYQIQFIYLKSLCV